MKRSLLMAIFRLRSLRFAATRSAWGLPRLCRFAWTGWRSTSGEPILPSGKSAPKGMEQKREEVMLGKNGGSDNRVELKGAIERQIMERTWRRVHDLQVRITKRGVVVSGRTGTYHVKQVAI